jgi:hypothetical protein
MRFVLVVDLCRTVRCQPASHVWPAHRSYRAGILYTIYCIGIALILKVPKIYVQSTINFRSICLSFRFFLRLYYLWLCLLLISFALSNYLFSWRYMLVYFVNKKRRAACCYRHVILYCLNEIIFDKHGVLIAKMCFDCMLHLSVCVYLFILYASMHIKCWVALDNEGKCALEHT